MTDEVQVYIIWWFLAACLVSAIEKTRDWWERLGREEEERRARMKRARANPPEPPPAPPAPPPMTFKALDALGKQIDDLHKWHENKSAPAWYEEPDYDAAPFVRKDIPLTFDIEDWICPDCRQEFRGKGPFVHRCEANPTANLPVTPGATDEEAIEFARRAFQKCGVRISGDAERAFEAAIAQTCDSCGELILDSELIMRKDGSQLSDCPRCRLTVVPDGWHQGLAVE